MSGHRSLEIGVEAFWGSMCKRKSWSEGKGVRSAAA